MKDVLRSALGCAIAITIMMLVAGFLVAFVYDVPKEVQKEVRTHKIVVVDAKGKPRMEIVVDDAGPRIRLWDTAKERRVDIYVDDLERAYGIKIADTKSDIGLERHWK